MDEWLLEDISEAELRFIFELIERRMIRLQPSSARSTERMTGTPDWGWRPQRGLARYQIHENEEILLRKEVDSPPKVPFFRRYP